MVRRFTFCSRLLSVVYAIKAKIKIRSAIIKIDTTRFTPLIIIRYLYSICMIPGMYGESISITMKKEAVSRAKKIAMLYFSSKSRKETTPDEFEMIKLHTTEGGRIIKDVMSISENIDYIRIATEIATSHHERWDGTGYPYRIAATKIPLSARIMAIADVFDALVSPRCYKDPIPQEKAFQIIQEESGTHFDPELVKIFLSAKDKAVTILENYSK